MVRSNKPETTIYTATVRHAGGSLPSPNPNSQRITLRTIGRKYAQGDPLTMVTAYDYPSAVHADLADMDLILVGDSVAMVVHGFDTTQVCTLIGRVGMDGWMDPG